MADSKITALTALTAADPVNDMFPVVDVSDTTMAASGTTKKISVNNILSSSPTASGALTVTGLVTAGSAAITGDLTVDTTTLVANASGYTDKVGIGTATPAATLHVKGSGRVDGDYNLFDFYKDNGSTRLGYLLFRDDGANYLNVNSNQPLYLTTNNTVQVQVETSGDVKIVTGNVVMGTSGKGIDFAATASGSGTMTSELLNDYEEGTWVGTIGGTTTNPTTSVIATGRYTKIGRQVSVEIGFYGDTTGASGRITVSGLPFTSNASLSRPGIIALDTMGTFTGSPVAYLAAGVTLVELFASSSNGSLSNVTHNAGAGRALYMELTYTV